jgi:hypothetical protein
MIDTDMIDTDMIDTDMIDTDTIGRRDAACQRRAPVQAG